MTRAWLLSVASLVGFLIGFYVVFTYALPLVLPFAVAVLVAELIDPLVRRMTWKGKVSRSLAVAAVLLVFVGLIVTALTAAIGQLVHEIQAVAKQLPYLYAIGEDLVVRFSEQFGAFHANLPDTIQDVLTRNLEMLQSNLSSSLPSVAGTLGVFGGLPSFITNMLVATIATFFMSRDRRQIFDFMLSLFPSAWRPKIRQVKVEVWASAMGFAKAQLMLILLTMTQTIIGLSIIGSNYAVLMGALVGFADVLPLLGPAAIFLPWIAYSFLFGSKVFGIKLLIVYAVVAGVRQVLEAKVVGDQIGLHPLAILLSMYLGFHFFGALGFVIGPLLAILLKSMIRSGLLPALHETDD